MPEDQKIGSYFTAPASGLTFIKSGATLLDCALGGGWPLGRISNVVGDRSVGKTLLAIEGCTNFRFAFNYPDNKIKYREVESAFDKDYAGALGMPIDTIDFDDVDENGKEKKPFLTVEEWANDIDKFVNLVSSDKGFYVLDSLDALSDEAEMDREITDSSYGANKAKKISELFRKGVAQKLEKTQIHLMVISQIRDNIGAMMGEKHSRSGGKALDFYASQIVYLTNMGKIKKTIRGIERPIGVKVKAYIKKNKVGLPYRTVEFPIYFGYGIDDLEANLTFLVGVDKARKSEITKDLGLFEKGFTDPKEMYKALGKFEENEFLSAKETIESEVKKTWYEIEEDFLPTRKKYA